MGDERLSSSARFALHGAAPEALFSLFLKTELDLADQKERARISSGGRLMVRQEIPAVRLGSR